jgi:hypothetical protein
MYRRYAQETQVSSEASRGEIERTLSRYGATSFAYGWQHGSAVLMFEIQNRRMKFVLPLPPKDDPKFSKTPTGRHRKNPGDAMVAWEKETRSRWRALTLAIKAKLQSSMDGIETIEEAFFAQLVLASGQTVGEIMVPQVIEHYKTGKMPKLLMPGLTK